ncbi:uracil-DNA glycosylase [Bdellovibrio bacteriovorus]|uniref:Uracil-DNA glycosylase n=1 Tax=Bdellovibrio bacteriovorus TaxID=959 RepID=A0A161PTE1_BDEBC|nr:uracil-DNA glycosylase [Bdellovibrio bacteriovorus]KYG68588.1 uracil-DNA glycosylase [Bdellovibrio bacteriovorus]
MENLKSEVKLDSSWKQRLQGEFDSERMKTLREFLVQEYKKGKTIYPRGEEWFAAMNLTPFDKVKVVIVGQDPYHGPGQAHGLCFSVRDGVRFPPSLQNIFKELNSDLGLQIPKSGCLTKWAEQGVLLLNAVLTVEDGKAAAHQKKGWEEFTDKIIHLLNEEREHLVFILWGSYAQKKASFVDRKKHLVIEAVHPSPLSAHRGFFGTKPFSKTNAYLRSHGISEIDWSL